MGQLASRYRAWQFEGVDLILLMEVPDVQVPIPSARSDPVPLSPGLVTLDAIDRPRHGSALRGVLPHVLFSLMSLKCDDMLV